MENKFAELIKDTRIAKKLSVRQCAKAVDMSPTYLVQVEESCALPPSNKIIHRMAAVLDIELGRLLSLANEQLEERNKATKITGIRVPFEHEALEHLKALSYYVQRPSDWQRLTEVIKSTAEKEGQKR